MNPVTSAQRAGPRSLPLASPKWSVTSETGRLTDVLLAAPAHLAMVPCNSVTIENLSKGLLTCPIGAVRQHRSFVRALESAGVRCHFVPPRKGMPDLCFTRDSVTMTPWGLVELRPSRAHRRIEAEHVRDSALSAGAPFFQRIEDGTVEGGDVCLVRDGLVAIGVSGDRTTEEGAEALASLFREHGWDAVTTAFDPQYLHLDTIMTMVADDTAVVHAEAVEDAFLARLHGLGIETVRATAAEVRTLSANFVSLGNRRVIGTSSCGRIAAHLRERDVEVIPVELDQVTRCGGGPRCLTMPLARRAPE